MVERGGRRETRKGRREGNGRREGKQRAGRGVPPDGVVFPLSNLLFRFDLVSQYAYLLEHRKQNIIQHLRRVVNNNNMVKLMYER